MLIVLGGLPGTGKTTIGRVLAARRSATYVRVDEIEHALRRHWRADEIGVAGYGVAFAIASSNLSLGNLVVADCVNPVVESRQGWRDVASRIAGAGILEIEIICSDETEHRRRVQTRVSDIDGFILPTWASVASHEYVAWTEPRLVIDTAFLSVPGAVAVIEKHLDAISKNGSPAP